MAEINVNKLRGKMAEKGYTITSLSNRLKISRATMSSYLRNPNKIPYEALSNMADLLCDNSDEAVEIFFSSNLRGA